MSTMNDDDRTDFEERLDGAIYEALADAPAPVVLALVRCYYPDRERQARYLTNWARWANHQEDHRRHATAHAALDLLNEEAEA
jgi:hypothetical protein